MDEMADLPRFSRLLVNSGEARFLPFQGKGEGPQGLEFKYSNSG